MRAWHLIPFSSGAVAYCFSYDMTHPSVWIGLGVFFAGWSAVLGIRAIEGYSA